MSAQGPDVLFTLILRGLYRLQDPASRVNSGGAGLRLALCYGPSCAGSWTPSSHTPLGSCGARVSQPLNPRMCEVYGLPGPGPTFTSSQPRFLSSLNFRI